MKSLKLNVAFAQPPRAGKVQASMTPGRARAGTIRDGRLTLTLHDVKPGPLSPASLVSLCWSDAAFSFFPHEVSRVHPILIPAYGAAVTTSDDDRGYEQILRDVQARGDLSSLQRIEQEPEESFDAAAAATISLQVPTWLVAPRDIRLFQVRPFERWTLQIVPRSWGQFVKVRGNENYEVNLAFGRNLGAVNRHTRAIEDGCLPILHGCYEDGDVAYRYVAFATMERGPVKAGRIRGTHYAVAHKHGSGSMMTPQQEQDLAALWDQETDEAHPTTLLALRITAINRGRQPQHAMFRMPQLRREALVVDERGLCRRDDGKVYAHIQLAGAPMTQPEATMLLQPGGNVDCVMYVSHQFLDASRAEAMGKLRFEEKLEECRSYWRSRVESTASVRVPERRVDQMVRAGLLHLDLITFGREPSGPLAPGIGTYSPIGSESAPIMQFYDSMGWHDEAARCIDFFLERQHDNGFIQNFGGYMLETGPALWTIGEHWRYTRDAKWARRVAAKVRKSCRFLLDWRKRNLRDDLRGRGYGLIEGQVADPVDHYRQFMLNGLSVLGLRSAAQVLAVSDANEARRLRREADRWAQDIRTAVAEGMARAPVMPLGDGTWAPTVPPWAEMDGASWQYVQPTPAWTHGGFTCRDSLIGPLYLLLAGVVDPRELWGQWLLQTHAAYATLRNAGPSQPYYCRHDWGHLVRGEVKPYLKTFYNQFAALADRETYSFFEHYYGVSSHKTHEEGWFLMQVRWMLWREDGDTLRLLSMVPRAWLREGPIELRGVATYFGKLDLTVEPDWNRGSGGRVRAQMKVHSPRELKRVLLRVPHPDGATARAWEGGRYDAASESVEVAIKGGKGAVELAW
jgi:hypothetical protein